MRSVRRGRGKIRKGINRENSGRWRQVQRRAIKVTFVMIHTSGKKKPQYRSVKVRKTESESGRRKNCSA